MDPLLHASLRLVHLAAGALWFGATAFGALVVGPAMQAAGEGGRPFAAALQRNGGPGRLMGPAAATAVVSGLLLYGFGGYASDPFGSASAAVLTLGAALALGTWLFGLLVGLPMQRRMAALQAAAAAPGGPSPEQAAEMRSLQARFQRQMKLMPALVAAVFVLMAARGIAAAIA